MLAHNVGNLAVGSFHYQPRFLDVYLSLPCINSMIIKALSIFIQFQMPLVLLTHAF